MISFMCRHSAREVRCLHSLEIWASWGGVCLIRSWSAFQLKKPKLLESDDFPEMGEKNDPLCRPPPPPPRSIHLSRWRGKQSDQPRFQSGRGHHSVGQGCWPREPERPGLHTGLSLPKHNLRAGRCSLHHMYSLCALTPSQVVPVRMAVWEVTKPQRGDVTCPDRQWK